MATQSLTFTFIYACYLLSVRRSDVAAPRKCVHKKQRSLPKGSRSLRMVSLLTGGVRVFMGRWYPKRVNKSTWCTYSYCFKWRALGAEGRANSTFAIWDALLSGSTRGLFPGMLRTSQQIVLFSIMWWCEKDFSITSFIKWRYDHQKRATNPNRFLHNIIIPLIVIKHTGSFWYAAKSSNIHVRVSSGCSRKCPRFPARTQFSLEEWSSSVQWAFPRQLLCNRAAFSKRALGICMRGLISGLGRRDSLSLSLSLKLGPVSRFSCSAGEVFIWGMMTEVGSC